MKSPLIVAHRGASAHRPEHTLAAYELALDQGADGLECDVRLTRDGHLVCIHDRRVDRTSTGRGVVSSQDLAELAAHDYGSWHHALPRSGQAPGPSEAPGPGEARGADDPITQPVAGPRREETGLLTLDGLLGLISDWPKPVQLFVETKHPVRYGGLVEARLVALLARHGLAAPEHREDSSVFVMSFSTLALRRIRVEAPTLPTVALISVVNPVRSGWLPPWSDIVGPAMRTLRADPRFVERAAAWGHPTYCWTADDPADVALCADIGVRYLATNHPGRTRELLLPREHA